MRTGRPSSLRRQGASLLAVILCAVLALPAQALTPNNPFPSAVRVIDETVCTGVFEVVAQPRTGLFVADNPVNKVDPSGHDGETSSLVTTMGQIGYLAGRTYAAVSNVRWLAYARLTPIIEKGWQALFWADVAVTTVGAAAVVAPEVLNLAADLGTRINRAYTMNTVDIPLAPGQGSGGQLGYGYTIENIGGQQLEAMGGGQEQIGWRSVH